MNRLPRHNTNRNEDDENPPKLLHELFPFHPVHRGNDCDDGGNNLDI